MITFDAVEVQIIWTIYIVDVITLETNNTSQTDEEIRVPLRKHQQLYFSGLMLTETVYFGAILKRELSQTLASRLQALAKFVHFARFSDISMLVYLIRWIFLLIVRTFCYGILYGSCCCCCCIFFWLFSAYSVHSVFYLYLFCHMESMLHDFQLCISAFFNDTFLLVDRWVWFCFSSSWNSFMRIWKFKCDVMVQKWNTDKKKMRIKEQQQQQHQP